MKERKYPNALRCLGCNTVLVSFSRHDFKTCGCPLETMIDGGYDYLRYGGKNVNKIELLTFKPLRKKK